MSLFKKYGLMLLGSAMAMGVTAGVALAAKENMAASQVDATSVVEVQFGSATGSWNLNSASSTFTGSLFSWSSTVTGTTSFTANGGFSQIGSSKSPATSIVITGTARSAFTMNKFTGKFGGFNSTAGTITAKAKGSQYATGSLSGASEVSVVNDSAIIFAKDDTFEVSISSISKGVKLISFSFDTSTGTTKALSSISASLTDSSKTWAAGDTVTVDDLTITANYSDSTSAAITSGASITSGATLSEGSNTVVVSYTEDGVTKTADVAINVLPSTVHAGTLEDPYSVADARKIANAGLTPTDVYVKGIYAETVSAWSESYGNLSINVSDDGTTDNTFEFYRLFAGPDSKKFTANILEVGKTIIAKGNITKYNDTCEFVAGCYWADTLNGISASATKTTGWTVGDTPTLTSLGATVTANYATYGAMDVTSYASLESKTLVAGDNNLAVSFTSFSDANVTKSDNITLTGVTVPVSGVVITAPESKTDVAIGEELQLTATVSPADSTEKTVTWASDNPSVATVSESGLVTGVAVGQAKITASCGGKTSEEYSITVYDSSVFVDMIVISGTLTKSSYYVGEAFDPSGLTVTGVMNDAAMTEVDVTSEVTWSPSTFNVAGDSVAVTATYINSQSTEVTDSTNVRVYEKALQSIEITSEPTKLTYGVGDTFDPSGIEVVAKYQLNEVALTDSQYEISSPDMSTHGTKTVTVSYGGKTDSFEITVSLTVVTGSVAKLEAVTSIADGDVISIGNMENKYAIDGVSGTSYATVASYTGASDLPDACLLTAVAGTGDYAGMFAFKFSDGYYLAVSDKTKTNVSKTTTVGASIFFTVSFSEKDATISRATGRLLKGRTDINPSRVAYYSTSSSYESLQIIKKSGGQKTEYADSELTTFIEMLSSDSLLVCSASGVGSTIAWDTIEGYYDMLSDDNKAILKSGNGKATADGGNVLENFLSVYDFLVGKKGYKDFIGRPEVASSSVFLGGKMLAENGETIVAIIVGASGIIATAGFFFLRKRKHA